MLDMIWEWYVDYYEPFGRVFKSNLWLIMHPVTD